MKSSHPDHPCKVQVNLDAHPRTKWFSPRVQKPSQIRPPITTKSISSYTGIKWSLIPNTKIHWSWTTHTKWMSMWMVRLKRNDFRPAFWKKKTTTIQQPNQFYLSTEIKSNLIPHPEFMSIWTTQTRNMSIFILILKKSDFRAAYK